METEKQEDVKETVTTIETVLSGQDLKQFRAAVKTWQSMPKSAMAMLSKMENIGVALNTLYEKGLEKKLSKQDLTAIARKAFEGLNRRERSEYRKLANNAKSIHLFVEFEGIKSANPTYLVNAWVKAQKEDIAACKLIEMELQSGLDIQSNPMNKPEGISIHEVPLDTKGKIIASDTPIKTGLHVESEPLSGNELTMQLGFIVNQIKTMFNKGKLSADNLTIIERHLTSAIQHINSVEADVALAM